MLSIKKSNPYRFLTVKTAIIAAITAGVVASISLVLVSALRPSTTVNPWWPIDGAHITGQQPFKADLVGSSVNEYKMFWHVDDGTWNVMETSLQDYPHKEVIVDISDWNWKGEGPYKVTYVATSLSGKVLASKSFEIFNSSPNKVTTPPSEDVVPVQPSAVTATAVQTSGKTTAPASSSSTGSLVGSALYVDSASSPAARQANEWRSSRPADAAIMDKIAAQSQTKWLGGWNADVETEVRAYTTAAAAIGAVPSVVAYNIPARDCGSYSAGGLSSESAYDSWINSIARGIGQRKTLVVLEPDAVAGMDCLSGTDRSARETMLNQAVTTLKTKSAAVVYIDAGNPRWVAVDELVKRLSAVNIAGADGFSLNVSNYVTTEENIAYGTKLAQKLNGKHFVIDTSRNGVGPTADSQWCNPSGRALGQAPTTNTGNSLVDAYLWIKTPGESDGTCNGGPSAGSWWPEYALGLAKTARW